MLLCHLSLQNFRNYTKTRFEFSPGINLITGPNTAGKTNLLEAIYLLAHGRSFRAKKDQEMITWGEEIARVKESGLEVVLATGFGQKQKAPFKKYLVNGVSRRQLDFIGNLQAVYFGPEDINLITDSPSPRRDYLDSVLEQVDKEYQRASLIYDKALRARNKLLLKKKNGVFVSPEEMSYWDGLLLENGPKITQKREEFIEFLNARNGSGRKLVYDKSLMSPTRLSQYSQEEVAAGVTLVGPQRDDFSFEFSGRNLASFGSRGEQRLAILWLKLGELEFMSQKNGGPPILLLDDIFSELDHENRHYVLEVIPRQQTIITTTDPHLIEKDYQKRAKVIELGQE